MWMHSVPLVWFDMLLFACMCAQVVKSNQATPIFQGHGEDDMLVAFSFGNMTSQLVSSFNNQLQFKSYPGLGHSSCEEVWARAVCVERVIKYSSARLVPEVAINYRLVLLFWSSL